MQKGGRRGSCGLSDLSESFMRTVLSFRLIHADCPIVSEWTIGLSARSRNAQCLTRDDSRGLSERSELIMWTVLSFRLIHADCPIISEWTIGLSACSQMRTTLTYQTQARLLALCYVGAARFWTIGISAQHVRIACAGESDNAHNNTSTAPA